jgi:hypothetical protein
MKKEMRTFFGGSGVNVVVEVSKKVGVYSGISVLGMGETVFVRGGVTSLTTGVEGKDIGVQEAMRTISRKPAFFIVLISLICATKPPNGLRYPLVGTAIDKGIQTPKVITSSVIKSVLAFIDTLIEK